MGPPVISQFVVNHSAITLLTDAAGSFFTSSSAVLACGV
jgi:hypothetical protein